MSTPTLLQNAVWIPEDDTYLVSSSVHDYVTHVFEKDPSLSISTDGGLEYAKRGGDFIKLDERYQEWCLTTDDPFEPTVVDKLLWGTLIKPAQDVAEIRVFRPIKEFSLPHLQAILKNCSQIGALHKRVVEYWAAKKRVCPFKVGDRIHELMWIGSSKGYFQQFITSKPDATVTRVTEQSFQYEYVEKMRVHANEDRYYTGGECYPGGYHTWALAETKKTA